MPAGLLGLEIPETALLQEDALAMQAWTQALAAGGMHVAIDDFGAGYGSLSALRRFPAEALKIDHSVVASLDSPSGAATVRAIVDLAHALGMIGVATGVQSASQLRMLIELGCDRAQGMYLGEPVSAHEMANLLRRGDATG